MEFSLHTASPSKKPTDCLIVGVYDKRKLTPTAQLVDEATDGRLGKVLKREDFKAKPGDTLRLPQLDGCRAERILVVGLGKKKSLDAKKYAKALDGAAKAVTGMPVRKALCALLDATVSDRDARWQARQILQRFTDATYRLTELKSEPGDLPALDRIDLHLEDKTCSDAAEGGAREGLAIAAGMKLTKDLGNLPGNLCTPAYLAEQARKLADRHGKITATVLEEGDMEKLGMGALLAVSRGSCQPARLIVLEYRGGKAKDQPVALVGKGLTFDAGGISIKPSQNMDEMKYDMCGGASVLGTFETVAQLGLPINLVGVVPASENLPDGNALKPGDIIKSLSGRTIEVLNTDAEGRLILCDALTYAERFQPQVVIDIATLTGACIVALGRHASGLLGNDDTLCRQLLDAGETSLDRAWQLPLWEEYQEQLKSNFADMANIGGREAGTITAACFLARYAENFRWAHLDIAGTAWNTGQNKGATGRPVPLLTQFLLNRIE
ncbi:leucyl aminopeptidase [Methylomarinovum caldicuralii]|uniref:Probable cytosol aminopeptidase n=1 Tax=Methylomarinovum caldicuralii TaxID=438856 RepID=A0AAU9C5D8_9GAMM|nr:leucyl aminopeptidase [Methylomarinovum caldicuralii]BCX82455.1 leucyl aminopeptidase [Methylomarinovum caldicuralii]